MHATATSKAYGSDFAIFRAGARNGSFRAQRPTMRGIRRSVGIALNKKTTATADDIIAMVPRAGPRLADLRDRGPTLAGRYRRVPMLRAGRSRCEGH